MSSRRQWIVAGALLVVVVVGVVLSGGLRGEVQPLTAGSRAPDFAAKTLDLEPRVKTIADYQGQVVLLNLWATWCEPCKVEMPSIEALYKRFKGAGLKVVAVAVDDPGFEDRVRRYVGERGFTFEVLSEGSGKIESDYQSVGIPSTYLIGRDGLIRKRVTGASDWNSPANRALVAQLLGVSE